MKLFVSIPFLVCLLALCPAFFLQPCLSSREDSSLTLEGLRDKSAEKVVYLSDSLFRSLFSADSTRSFTLVVFFMAKEVVAKNPGLNLEGLKADYIRAAQAYLTAYKGSEHENSVFFSIAELKDSQLVFKTCRVETLPFITLLPAGHGAVASKKDLKWEIYGRSPEDIARFVSESAGVPSWEVKKAPAFSPLQIAVISVFLLALIPFAFKYLINHRTPFHEPHLWCFGALCVYYFSVSGSMYNIIRGMPAFTRDRDDPAKIVYFYSSSGAQFWAEGFCIGSLYLSFGLLMALVTYLAPLIKSKQVQRGAVFACLAIGYLAVKQLVYLDNWKTGYGIHGYFPKRWKI